MASSETIALARGIYRADGSAVALIGQPAIATLRLMTGQETNGPLVPQDLSDRSFVQRLTTATGTILVEVVGILGDPGEATFTLSADTLAALIPIGVKALDLIHEIVELVQQGEDLILTAPFGLRRSLASAAAAVLTPSSKGGETVIVRYAGAPGRSFKKVAQDAGELPDDATDLDAVELLRAPATEAAAAVYERLPVIDAATAAAQAVAEDVSGSVIVAMEAAVSTNTDRRVVSEALTQVSELAEQTTTAAEAALLFPGFYVSDAAAQADAAFAVGRVFLNFTSGETKIKNANLPATLTSWQPSSLARLDERIRFAEVPGLVWGIDSQDDRLLVEFHDDYSIKGPYFDPLVAKAEAGAGVAEYVTFENHPVYIAGFVSADERALFMLRRDLSIDNPQIEQMSRDVATALALAQRGGARAPTMGFFGNSITDQAIDGVRTFARGFVYWLHILTDARFSFSQAWDFGISGDTTADMKNRLQPVQDCPASIIGMMMPATNDCPVESGISTAGSLKNLIMMQDALLDTGKLLIYGAEQGRGIPEDLRYRLDQPGELDHLFEARRWEMAQAQVPGVYVADASTACCEPLTSYWDVSPGLTADGIHPVGPGAFRLAASWAQIINQMLPPVPRLVASNADLRSATAPFGNRIENGVMAGTGGVLAGGADGEVAEGWTLTGTTGVTVTGSKIVMPNGMPGQRVRIVGTPTGRNVDLTRVINIDGLLVGDVLEQVGGIRVAANNGAWLAAPFSFLVSYPTAAGIEPTSGAENNNVSMPTDAWAGTICVPRLTLAEVPTAIMARCRVVLNRDQPIDLTIDWHQLSNRNYEV